MKHYFLKLYLAEMTYQLTGADDDATVSQSTEEVVTTYVMNRSSSSVCYLQGLRPFKIVKARLTSNMPGLNGHSTFSGTFPIKMRAGSNQEEVGQFTIVVGEWNKWEKKNIDVTLSSDDPSLINAKTAFYVQSGAFLGIMDFNIQDDFVGETVRPYLELEIEADNIVDVNGNAV